MTKRSENNDIANVKLPISLVIITYNEEKNVARVIESVPWANEVIVVDSGSTDRTVEIAKSLGAKTHLQNFLGFKKQKQFATDMSQNDWVLNLDADEMLSPELSKEIQELYNVGFTFDGYMIPRLSYHLGRWIRHGGWHPDNQLRLFNKKKARWGGGHVHEKVEAQKVGKLKKNILHFVFRDLTHQVEVNNKYSSLGARELFENKKKFCILKLIFKPISKFIELYFYKKGFLDGLAGFVIAVGAAYSVFLKFSKLKELQDPNFQNTIGRQK